MKRQKLVHNDGFPKSAEVPYGNQNSVKIDQNSVKIDQNPVKSHLQGAFSKSSK